MARQDAFSKLKPWADGGTELCVVIETPKGSRNKFAFDAKLGVFKLKKVLPAGMSFPYDFGFVPSTLAEDGDPIDVLVLMDEPAVTGCVLSCRLIGVIEGETIEGGTPARNDRLIGIECNTHSFAAIKTLNDLGDRFVKELETFFSSYHQLSDHEYRVIASRGPRVARDHVEAATKRASRGARRRR
jgi:inorganic pyrophosphatase